MSGVCLCFAFKVVAIDPRQISLFIAFFMIQKGAMKFVSKDDETVTNQQQQQKGPAKKNDEKHKHQIDRKHFIYIKLRTNSVAEEMT